jgi:hypothetical protein
MMAKKRDRRLPPDVEAKLLEDIGSSKRLKEVDWSTMNTTQPRDYESEVEITKPDGTKVEREVEDEDARLKASRIALYMGMTCSVVCAGVAGVILLKAPHYDAPTLHALVAAAFGTFGAGCLSACHIAGK